MKCPALSSDVWNVPRCVAVLAVLTLGVGGCYGSTSKIEPIGGGWSIEEETMHGSEASLTKNQLLRGTTVVDEWVDHYRVFPPDCVVYSVKRAEPWFAVCGNRTPIQLPEWILEVRDDGPWGGYVATTVNGTTTERWSRLPLDKVVDAAQQQRRFFSILGWKPPSPAPPFERVFVDVVHGPPPPVVRPVSP